MGPPICLIVANIFIEAFEIRSVWTAENPTDWRTCVDDTFVVQKET